VQTSDFKFREVTGQLDVILEQGEFIAAEISSVELLRVVLPYL